MPQPLAICLEDLDAAIDERFLRCVAVPGRRPGLRVDAAGAVLWRSDERVACELWVSADDKLILFRPAGAAAVRVTRAGRSLEAPEEKPVVLRAADEVAVGGRRLRVHVHGPSSSVVAPSPLPAAERPGSFRRAAAVVAVGAALGAAATLGAGCGGGSTGTQTPEPESSDASVVPEPDAAQEDIEIRYQPPAPPEDMMLYQAPPEPVPEPSSAPPGKK
jgi:hypothetical protein